MARPDGATDELSVADTMTAVEALQASALAATDAYAKDARLRWTALPACIVRPRGVKLQTVEDGARAASECEPLTLFHSDRVPTITLRALAEHIVRRHASAEATQVAVALAFMRRYEAHAHIAVTTHMMHRILAAAVFVAAKATSDFAQSAAAFAAVCGLTRTELLRLEIALLCGMGWDVCTTDLRLSRERDGPPLSSRAFAVAAAWIPGVELSPTELDRAGVFDDAELPPTSAAADASFDSTW